MTKFAVRYLKNSYYPLEVPENITIKCGDMLLCRTEKGEEALKAICLNDQIVELWNKSKLKPEPFHVIRVLTEKDNETLSQIKEEEIQGYFKCKELIKSHKLNMNLVQCRLTFDRKKISFYYTAPERVDFRNLLKDLTQTFKRIRIDLRHIGVRDETKIMGGYGICARQLCCNTFLPEFAPVTSLLFCRQN